MTEYFRRMDPEGAEAERIATFVSKENFISGKMQQQQQHFARITVFVNESSAHLLLTKKKSCNHCCSIDGLKGKLIKCNAYTCFLLLPTPTPKVE